MKSRQKRGQAAMEFLMTYGWALLVVLVAIGALAFFGVLNPSKFLPNSCTLGAGFSCSEFRASAGSNNIKVVIQNGLGEGLSSVTLKLANTNIQCQLSNLAAGSLFSPSTITLGDGASTTLTLNCWANQITNNVNDKFKGDLELDYLKGTSPILHKKIGQLVLGIEP